MSWSSGSVIMSEIITALKTKIPDDKLRQEVYEALIPPFEDNDCDTLYECVREDEAFKAAMKEVSFFEEEDDVDEVDENYYDDE